MKPLVSLQILTIAAVLVLLPALGDMHSLLIRDVSAIAARPPVKGDFAGIALRVDFPDLKGSTPANDTLSILTFASSYWHEVSYGMVTMKWDVAQKWITAPKDRAYYSQKPADSRTNSSRYIELLRYSVNKTNVDLAKYDLFVLVFAGRGAEESRNNLDLWSWAFWPVDGSGPLATLGTYAIRAFALVPEIAGIGGSATEVKLYDGSYAR